MHLPGYTVERKGPRKGYCGAAADVPGRSGLAAKGHRDYRWLRQCRSAMTAKKSREKDGQRMLHQYMIGQKMA